MKKKTPKTPARRGRVLSDDACANCGTEMVIKRGTLRLPINGRRSRGRVRRPPELPEVRKDRIALPRIPRISKQRLEGMIEEATIDCYNESEQLTGWFTMIDENLAVPFDTQVLGVSVTVERVDLNRSGQIVAVCTRGRDRQTLPILDLPLPTPRPAGVEWIEAYRQWRGEG